MADKNQGHQSQPTQQHDPHKLQAVKQAGVNDNQIQKANSFGIALPLLWELIESAGVELAKKLIDALTHGGSSSNG